MTAPSRTGGQILVDQLLIHGVDHIFCVPGESYLAALDALHDASIEVTVCRQEGGAAMMAEAYGKLTGRPGICFVTRGPGATNASPGIHIAKQDSTPMILFVGQIERGMREREAFQELDYRAAFGPLAKWATEVDDPARFPEIVSRAFHVATSGRPGPVVIALPEDVLTEMAAVADAPRYQIVETHPGLTQMAELQKLLRQCQESRRAARRQPLVRGRGAAHRTLRGTLRIAGRLHLPPSDAVSRRSRVLCRRSRARRESEAACAHQGRRSRAARRRAPVGDCRARPTPCSTFRRRSRSWCMSIPIRANRPGLCPHLAINASPIAFTAALGGRASAGLAALERGHEGGACGLSGLERSDRRSVTPARCRWAR